jgi:hypothetical protein
LTIAKVRSLLTRASKKYVQLAENVFKADQVADGVVPADDDQCCFDYKVIERALKNLVAEQLGDESRTTGVLASELEQLEPKFVATFVLATRA